MFTPAPIPALATDALISAFVASSSNVTSGGADETFAIDIGAAGAKVVAVLVQWYDAGSGVLQNCTIAGVSAIAHISSAGRANSSGLFYAEVTAGGTQDVFVELSSGTLTNVQCQTINVTGYTSSTAESTDTSDANATTVSTTLNVSEGASVIATANYGGGTTDLSFTAGADEVYDSDSFGSLTQGHTGLRNELSAATPHTITHSAGSGHIWCACAAAWI